MGAFSETSKWYKAGIIAKAVELGYSPENICVLQSDLDTLRDQFPRCYENLESCLHNKDKRSLLEYARDLVASWIFEDTIVQLLNEHGLQTSLAGTDKNREILTTTKVSACSDCEICLGEKSRLLEIMSDYTGWWERMGHMELRDAKYAKLVREKSLFLGICTVSRKYVLFDFSTPVNAIYIPSHRPYGGKPAYSIQIKGTALSKFSMPSLVSELKQAINAL